MNEIQFTILNVTNEQLTASVLVTLIFCIILLCAIVISIYKIIKSTSVKSRLIRSALVILISIGLYLSYRQYDLEKNLLQKPLYTDGTTIGFGNVFLKGAGIMFEYEVNGIKYRNSNTYHPIPVSNIKVPDGKYMVRYSAEYISKGRVDFSKPIN